MAYFALQQRQRPDAETASTVDDAAAPRALAHEAVGAAGIGEAIESRERQLDVDGPDHRESAVPTMAVFRPWDKRAGITAALLSDLVVKALHAVPAEMLDACQHMP